MNSPPSSPEPQGLASRRIAADILEAVFGGAARWTISSTAAARIQDLHCYLTATAH